MTGEGTVQPDKGMNGQAGSITHPFGSGGESCALDMHNERDRGLVRNAMQRWPKRWRGLSDEFKDAITASLGKARNVADCLMDCEGLEQKVEGAQIAVSAARTAAMMEGQHQKDDHESRQDDRERNAPPAPVFIKVEFDKGG